MTEKKKKKISKEEAKYWADASTIETSKASSKKSAMSLGVLSINYDRYMLEKKGIDYLETLLAEIDEQTWVKTKNKIPFELIIDKLKLKESEIKEIWKHQIKETDRIQKELKEDFEEKQKERNKKIENDLGYIWDEKDLREEKVFPVDIVKDRLYFGLMMPKIVENIIDGKVIGKMQRKVPCLITNNKEFIEWGIRAEEDNNIAIYNIPSELPYRWKLDLVKKYLSGETEKVDGKELIKKVSEQYIKYISIINKTWYKIHALWDIGTYFYPIFEAYPFMELRGIAGTGKSKTMTVSSYITFNGGNIMINPSEATLFRIRDDTKGTLYLDEAEKLWKYNPQTKQYEGDVRTELINASYTKEGKVPRMEKNAEGQFRARYYRPYGPTMLGSINGLYGATETRAITRITTKSTDIDKRGENEPSENRHDNIWCEIRDECYRFALENWKEVKEIYNNLVESKLKRRELQIWKPILALAKFIDKEIYNEIENFALELSTQRVEDNIPDTSFDYAVLSALRRTLNNCQTNPLLIQKGDSQEGKIYIKHIKESYCIEQKNPQGLEDKYLNRNISIHLDKLGFKEYRKRDGNSTYFEITKDMFDQIIASIVPDLVFNPSKVRVNTNESQKFALLSTSIYTKNSLSTQNSLVNVDDVDNVDDLGGKGGPEKNKKIEKLINNEGVSKNNSHLSTHLHLSTLMEDKQHVDNDVDVDKNICIVCSEPAIFIKEDKKYCEKHIK